MLKRRVMVGMASAAAIAAAVAVAPAIGATGTASRPDQIFSPSAEDIGTFTPAAADPRLAALLAKSGIDQDGFRFTPAQTRHAQDRRVTVAVRARSTAAAAAAERETVSVAAAPAALSLAPIAYNLGVSVGWKRFAVAGDMTHVDLAGQPGARDSVGASVSYTGKKFSGRVRAAADKPAAGTPALVAEQPGYLVDVGGSYSLTHNLDVTAGVRYRGERERLDRSVDDRRDSQAVYIGTAFRF